MTSILGQQISWMAARSITHKFIRLYDPSLPEKPVDDNEQVERTTSASFPTPSQVATTQVSVLRGVGLSGRKAEYGTNLNFICIVLRWETVIELAARFADGRLSAEKLTNASDERLAEMLTEVRGIGMVRLRSSHLSVLIGKYPRQWTGIPTSRQIRLRAYLTLHSAYVLHVLHETPGHTPSRLVKPLRNNNN